MKHDIVLAGVGGQGVLSVSAVIARAALDCGLQVKQSEVHGMAQRGGAVLAHLRLSDDRIWSDLIPSGSAALLVSMEPLESLRYLDLLAPDAEVVTAIEPVANLADYPPLEQVLAAVRRLPRHALIDADRIAKAAGSARAVNMVMVGAASRFLPVAEPALEKAIARSFERKGRAVVDQNLAAFHGGRAAAA